MSSRPIRKKIIKTQKRLGKYKDFLRDKVKYQGCSKWGNNKPETAAHVS